MNFLIFGQSFLFVWVSTLAVAVRRGVAEL